MKLPWRQKRRPEQRRGLTLLELLLSLALTTVIMAAIGMAIRLHLRALDIRRTDVEQAQLAHSLLQIIANDLRSTVIPNDEESSGVESSAAAALGIDTAELEEFGAELGAELGMGDLGGDTGLTGTEETYDVADATTLPATPGLYGNQYELQMDVGRIPRVEEYQAYMTPESGYTLLDIPSDLKTVAYYMGSANELASGYATGAMGAAGMYETGLIRRQLDRAVTMWATQSGNYDGLLQNAELIAPEVTALEFQYFDGLEWLMEWDSETQGGLPVAVQITIAIRPPITDAEETGSLPTAGATFGMSGMTGMHDLVYQLMVRLPTAEPTNEAFSTTEETGL